jgi:hypothetical protein
MKIDWKYPKPRSGFLGSIDTVIGPGATKYEKLLICHILHEEPYRPAKYYSKDYLRPNQKFEY